jgi:transcriptional regulator with XRE-family HTH domain
MTENIEGLHGNYRRFTSAEVGLTIRLLRRMRGLKRTVLAAEAHVSEKTLERAEAGEGISEDSSRRIARALGMKETAFTEERFIPTLEEAVRLQETKDQELRKTHRSVAVARVGGPRDVLPLFENYGLFADDMNVADGHLKDFANLKQALVDYGDISGDLTAAQRVEAAEGIVKDVREFETLGYVIKVGTARDYQVHGEEWPCSVMAAFKKPTGMLVTPDEVWLPKTARFGL